MTGQYEPSDFLTYGAADAEEMNSILDAVERADRREARVAELVSSLLEVAPEDASQVGVSTLQKVPAVIVWWHGQDIAYVGSTTNLRTRMRQHLSSSLDLSGSALRRNVCELLFKIAPATTANPEPRHVQSEQAAAVRAWLLSGRIGLAECSSKDEAESVKERLLALRKPSLSRR